MVCFGDSVAHIFNFFHGNDIIEEIVIKSIDSKF